VSAVVLAVAVVLAGCGPADVNQLRGNYVAQLNGWVVKEEPMAIVSGIDTVAGDEQAAAPVEGEDESTEPMSEPQELSTDAVVTTKTVILDILLQHKSGATLPGITLDVTQADSQHNEKHSWKVWVDTSQLAGTQQFTHTLENVELDEGDVFNVEVRSFVPESERSEYKEFSPPS